MVAAWSGFMVAVLLPSRTTGDLLAGMRQLLSMDFPAVPKTLVWDNESGIGQHRRLTVGARAFAGTLGTRIFQTRPRDPEAKVHLYGKGVRPGRKIGHVNVSGTELADLRERARHAAGYIEGAITQ